MSQITVISGAGRRRRWTEEDRARILGEAFAPGARPTRVAQDHDVATSLLYEWLRQALRGAASTEAFAPVVVIDERPSPASTSPRLPTAPPVITVEFAGVAHVSIGSAASPALIAATLKALR